jgi:hypothetical protein
MSAFHKGSPFAHWGGGGEAMRHCPKAMHHVQRAYGKVELKSFYVQRTNKRMKCPMKKMMVVTNGFLSGSIQFSKTQVFNTLTCSNYAFFGFIQQILGFYIF